MSLNDLEKKIKDYLIQNENKLRINSKDILKGDVFISPLKLILLLFIFDFSEDSSIKLSKIL